MYTYDNIIAGYRCYKVQYNCYNKQNRGVSMSLTQVEADALLSMKKRFDITQRLELPITAIDQSHTLTSLDGR